MLSPEMYEILSLLARYFFAGLMALIVLRAWRITVKDNRRAKVLRDWSPETGCVGQLVIGGGKRDADPVPIPKEGVLGSSRKADIPVRGAGVLAEHAHVEARCGGLLIRPLGRARMAIGKGDAQGGQLFAQDGDVLTIGETKALVVLFDPGARIEGTKGEAGAASDSSRPAGKTASAGRARAKAAPAKAAKPVPTARDEIDFFDEDAIWREPNGKSKRRS